MKALLTSFLLLVSYVAMSQTWCDPGANWKYSYSSGFGAVGYVEISYVGDTLINTQMSQKLSKNLLGYDLSLNQPINWFIGTEYTYEDNGVVFLRHDNDWDTLYNFNANVGDTWRMAKQPLTGVCDSNSTLTVIAEGTTTINALSLNYKVVQFNYGGTWQNGTTDTIIEKIGFTGSYMFPYDMCNAALDAQEGGPFRCYEDDNFASYKPHYAGNCDFTVGIEVINSGPKFRIAPNPANTQIELIGLNTQSVISIMDLQGRNWPVIRDQNLIIIDELPCGIYILSVRDKLGAYHQRFIKQ